MIQHLNLLLLIKGFDMSRQKFFLFVLTACTLFHLTSCRVYKPTGYNAMTQNVPLLNEKYEVQTVITGGFNHAEEQVAFSPTEHLSLMGSFYQNLHKTKGYSAEGGIGYHTTFADVYVMEAYGIFTNTFLYAHVQDDNGYGFLMADTNYNHDLNSNYNSYSLQFNIGRKVPHFEFGLALRYGLVDYSNFYYHLKTETDYFTSDTTYFLDNNLRQFLTVAPVIKFGWPNFKFLFQFSYHADLSKKHAGNPKDYPPYYSPLLLSIALVADISFNRESLKYDY